MSFVFSPINTCKFIVFSRMTISWCKILSTNYETEFVRKIRCMLELVLSVVNVVAGDANSIRVGSGTNIQDHSLVSVDGSRFSGGSAPAVIGNKVTIGEC